MKTFKIIILFLLVEFIANANANPISLKNPLVLGFNKSHLQLIDSVMIKAVIDKNIPGGVVVVGRNSSIVYLKGFGYKQVYKNLKKMKINTIFDLASLTKPVATASSIWKLVEMGKLTLWDRVTDFIPNFKVYEDSMGKKYSAPRIYHLLTHTAGLRSYLNVDTLKMKYGKNGSLEKVVNEIAVSDKIAAPGEQFTYSCLGFITLAYIVQKVSGMDLAEFSKKYIFEPMNMRHTFFKPSKKYRRMIAPTEVIDGKMLLGEVHDPLARFIGGISGNAGLFSTAEDLSKFAIMLLNNGMYEDKRIFSPLTVNAMTSIFPYLADKGRSPGWDVKTAYSSVRGDILGMNSFGHSGYTGTSMWIDFDTGIFIIILTNRVHPYDEGSVLSLRAKIANIVASSLINP